MNELDLSLTSEMSYYDETNSYGGPRGAEARDILISYRLLLDKTRRIINEFRKISQENDDLKQKLAENSETEYIGQHRHEFMQRNVN